MTHGHHSHGHTQEESNRGSKKSNKGIANYGVWAAQPTRFTAEARNTSDKSPHITLYFQDGNGSYSAAINVKSTDKSDSELAYWLNRNFTNSITNQLKSLQLGFHAASNNDSSPFRLDYVREKLVDFSQASILPYNENGRNNDILDELEPVLTDAINAKATVFIFGSSYNTGIHDVHMNQGSPGYDNAVYSDGALIFYYPTDGHFEGVFLAFASQEIPTDDTSGEPLQNSQTLASLAGDGQGGNADDNQ